MRVPVFIAAIALAASTSLAAPGAETSPAPPAPAAPAPAAPALEATTLGSVETLHASGDLLMASQPSAADLALASERGVRTVITLRLPEESVGFDERATVEQLGLVFEALPWDGVEQLTDEIFDRMREILATSQRPILLHCGSGNRVGAAWLPYRVLDEGQPVERALDEARTVGLKTAEYEKRALDYVAARTPPK